MPKKKEKPSNSLFDMLELVQPEVPSVKKPTKGLSAGLDDDRTYDLDVAKWRCGANSSKKGVRLGGTHRTSMHTLDGYMCCLGQFAAQRGVDPEIYRATDENGKDGIATPYELQMLLQKRKKLKKGKPYDRFMFDPKAEQNTALASRLMMINDSVATTIDEKIEGIRNALHSNGIRLRVLNRASVR